MPPFFIAPPSQDPNRLRPKADNEGPGRAKEKVRDPRHVHEWPPRHIPNKWDENGNRAPGFPANSATQGPTPAEAGPKK